MYCEVKGPTPAPPDDREGGIEDAGGEGERAYLTAFCPMWASPFCQILGSSWKRGLQRANELAPFRDK